MDKQTIRIEMDDNTASVIRSLLTDVDRENARSEAGLSPGDEIRKAFGIDVAKILTSVDNS